MRLFLMRHGPAEDVSESGRDADRRLTTAGKAHVAGAARAFLAIERPSRVISSPLVRAFQTAEILIDEAKRLGFPLACDTRRELAQGGRTADLAREIVARGEAGVILVGHEPDLSDATEDFSGRSIEVKKSMVLAFDLTNASGKTTGRLDYLVDPATHAKIT